MSWLKYISYVLLCLAGLIISAVLFVLSPWGGRLAINLTNHYVDGLQMEYASGGLLSGLQLKRLTWQQPGQQVQIDDMLIDVRLSCLVNGQLCIQTLRSGQSSIKLTAQTEQTTTPSTTATPLVMPLPIHLEQLLLGPTRIELVDQGTLSWQQLSASGRFLRVLLLQHLKVNNLQWDGQAKQQPTQAIDWRHWQYKPVNLAGLTLPIAFNLQDVQFAPVTLSEAHKTVLKIHQIQLQAKSKKQQIILSKLALNSPLFDAQASGQLSLNTQLTHQLNMQLTGKKAPYADQIFTLTSQGSLADLRLTGQLQGDMGADFKAKANLTQANLPIELQLSWQNLHWPLQAPDYQSQQGNIELSGDLQQLVARLDITAAGKSIPAMQLTSQMHGKITEAVLDKFTINTLGGSIEGQGKLTYQQQWHWLGQLALNHIQTQQYWPSLSSNISGQLHSEARFDDKHWQVALNKLAITGNWQHLPLSVTGHVAGNDQQGLQINQLHIHNGDNQLAINGHISQQQQLDVNLQAKLPDISKTVPDVGGQLQLQADIKGSVSQPLLTLQLQGNKLSYQHWQLASVNATGKLDWQGNKPVQLNVEASQLTSLNHRYDHARLDVKGNADKHQISVAASGDQASFSAKLTGSLGDHQWHGLWQQGDINIRYAQLTLQHPFAIDADWAKQQYQIAPNCWQHQQSKLCIEQALYQHNQAQWAMQLNNLLVAPILNRLNSHLPTIQSDSQLSMNFSGSWPGKGLPNASLHASLSPADWLVDQPKKLTLAINHADIDADLSAQKLNLQALIGGNQIGQLKLNANVDPRPGKRKINGQVTITKFDLHPFMGLSPTLDRLAGVLQANIKVSGDLAAPQLNGQINISNGELAGGDIPVVLTQWQQNILLQGNKATLSGDYKLGGGQGKIGGQLQWQPQLSADINLQGQDLDVKYQGVGQFTVSPDITVHYQPQQLAVDGKIVVPKARIKIRELPESALSPSSDVVVVNRPEQEPTLTQRLQLNVTLQVDPKQRNQVKLDAFGLTTDLQGELALQQRQQNLIGNGSIQIVNGRYKAYGQNLIIRQGELAFSGPLDKPHISVEAIRDPSLTADNVTAGLRVNGSIDHPDVEVFSDPAMEQPQSLSYLLRGQSLNSGNDQSQDSVLTSMLLGFGLGRSENLVTRVGSKLGVKDLSLATSGQGDETQLALTGFIAPGVQLRYGMGLFSTASEVALRYQINSRLYLEAVSGLNNALDLYYSFSWDDDDPALPHKKTAEKTSH